MPRSKSAVATPPVSSAPLTALELKVAVEFVTAAAGTYGDHSCNDFELPDTPTRRALVQAAIDFERHEGDERSPLHALGGMIYFYDDHLMRYLGSRWEALAERAESGMAIEPPLCREELETMASVLDMLARNEYKEYATLRETADYSLDLTPQGQQFAEAAIHHAAGGADKIIKASEFGYDIHAVKCLKYLAARCQTLAAVSPEKGLAFADIAALLPLRHDGSARWGTADAIPVLKRPGIGPRWLKAWKDAAALWKMQAEEGYGGQEDVDRFKQYAARSGDVGKDASGDRVGPPYRSWELLGFMSSKYDAARISIAAEEEAFKSDAFPIAPWRSSFALAYLESFSTFCFLLLSRVRFPSGERRPSKDFFLVFFAAMGMAMGFREHALRMVRLQLLAHRLGIFHDPRYFPAAQTLLRIFADYLGEPPLKLKGEALTHPIYNALAKHWRHADAEALVPVLLAVCDEHTRRNVRGRPYDDEFDFEYFGRTPVEVLLVFKLREELGLVNPKLDHPLMNTPLGILPKETRFEFDDLLALVVKRMRQDHFDEDNILADFVAATTNQPLIAQHPLHTHTPWPVVPDTATERQRLAARQVRAAEKFKPGDVFRDGPIYPEMVVIAPGNFLMGLSNRGDSDTYPQHKVTINYPLAVGKYPVTQQEWLALMGNNVSYFKDGGLDCPMENVGWDDTQEYLRRLNARTGRKYRLLTEAEWEYACRAGSTTRFCYGDDLKRLKDYAWFKDNSDGKTHPVGQKLPNAWGLHDMHGNVREWVQDSYLRSYKSTPTDGSAPEKGERYKMQRGGSVIQSPDFLSAHYRSPCLPEQYSSIDGFRIALMLA